MGENRKPSTIILLRNQGKSNFKIELFPERLFENGYIKTKRWRIRVNGKWFDKTKDYVGMTYFTKWEFRDVLFKSMDL